MLVEASHSNMLALQYYASFPSSPLPSLDRRLHSCRTLSRTGISVPVNGKRYNVEYLEEHGAGRSSVEQRSSRDPGPFQVCVAAGATDLILKLRSW